MDHQTLKAVPSGNANFKVSHVHNRRKKKVDAANINISLRAELF